MGMMGGMGMMGMMPGMYGLGGMGMYGGGGMMGSQWLMSLNQFLFGVQSVVFSLGQAVQIVGMNAQQIRHVYESVKGMVENALGQVNKLGQASSWEEVAGQVLGSKVMGEGNGERSNGSTSPVDDNEREGEEEILTQNEIIRRRRLAAFRWTMSLSMSYVVYKTVRRLVRALLFGGGANQVDRGNYQMQQHSQGYYGGGGMSNQYGMMGGTRGRYHNQYGDGINRYGGNQYDQYSQGYGDTSGYY